MFAAFAWILFAAHHLADYPLQTDRQAACKAGWTEGEGDPNPGRHHHGWGANLVHAGTHVATTAALLGAGVLLLGLHPTTAGIVAALTWIGVSHSVIDRRWLVRWWMEHTGQSGYRAHGGAQHVDQAFHIGLGLLPAAVMLAAL